MSDFSPRGTALAKSLAMTLNLLREHRKLFPGECDSLYRMVIAHVRSDRPQLLIHSEMDQ